MCSLVMYRLVYPTLQFRMVNRDMDMLSLSNTSSVHKTKHALLSAAEIILFRTFFKQRKHTLWFMSSTLKANHQYNLITNTLPTSSKYTDIQQEPKKYVVVY